MSNPNCNIDLADSSQPVRTFTKVDGSATQKLTNLINASLDTPQKRSSRKSRHLVGVSTQLPLEVTSNLRWLYENSSEPLFELIKGRLEHASWQKALKLRNIALLEQIKLLHDLVLLKGYNESIFTSLFDKALDSENDAHATFAILAYFMDQHPESFHDAAFNHVEAFEKKLHAANQQFDLFLQKGLPEALSVQLPKAVAKLLLTSTGEINFGLIPLIKEKLLRRTSNCMRTVAKRLDMLHHDSSLRVIFPKISSPMDPNNRSTELLQILHELPPNATVTDQHARETVLAAFLSHLRQISPNGCFAMTVCLSELETNPRQCLEDFSNLLTKGSLTREFNHVQREYPFLLTATTKNLNRISSVDDPLIQAACKAMGIADYEKIRRIKHPLTAQEIINELAGNDAQLRLRGSLAYEFQTRNGFLAMWHNCVAGMSEGKVSGLVTSGILHAVVRALTADFKGLDAKHQPLTNRLHCCIVEVLLSRISVLFDPGLEHPISGNGGFVLYDLSASNTDAPRRIDNPKAFKEWILSILDQVAEEPNFEDESEQSEESQILFQHMITGLKKCIFSDQFLDRLLEKYMDQNIKEPSKHLETIPHAPWITRTGNSSEATLSVYLNKSGGDLKSKTFKIVSAENLLEQLHEFYQLRRLARSEIPQLMPARVLGLHAFNLIPLTPSYSGVPILKERITPSIRYQEKMIALVKENTRLEELNIKATERKSLRQFRNALLEAWNKGSLIRTEDLQNRERLLDSWMINALSYKKKQKILGAAIPIGDSNFAADDQDLYFYCLYNPLSKKIELWRMGTDFSDATALNPSIWINEQTWEVFYI